MRNDYWIPPVIFVSVFLMFLIHWSGRLTESTRIYDNCLKNNGTMSYNEADKMCKEIVK